MHSNASPNGLQNRTCDTPPHPHTRTRSLRAVALVAMGCHTPPSTGHRRRTQRGSAGGRLRTTPGAATATGAWSHSRSCRVCTSSAVTARSSSPVPDVSLKPWSGLTLLSASRCQCDGGFGLGRTHSSMPPLFFPFFLIDKGARDD